MYHSIPARASTDRNAATALYNPFPTFPFTGSLRPIYPLSDRRSVPESIKHPNYARTKSGNPEYTFANRNTITCLDKKQQKGMRKSCRLAREVLDAAARELKPGVTTDYIDEVVHRECIKRDVSSVTQDPMVVLLICLPVISITSELLRLPEVLVHLNQRGHMPRNT